MEPVWHKDSSLHGYVDGSAVVGSNFDFDSHFSPLIGCLFVAHERAGPNSWLIFNDDDHVKTKTQWTRSFFNRWTRRQRRRSSFNTAMDKTTKKFFLTQRWTRRQRRRSSFNTAMDKKTKKFL